MPKITALYSQYETDNKRAIDNQMAELNNYCEEKNIQNFKHYIDNNESGANLNRPAFKEMIQDSVDGEIDKIIVTNITRISRSALKVAQIIHYQIKLNQAKLITLNSGEYWLDDYDPEQGFFCRFYKKFKKKFKSR